MAQVEGSNNAMRIILGNKYSRCEEAISSLRRARRLVQQGEIPIGDLAKIRAEAQELLYQIGKQVMRGR